MESGIVQWRAPIGKVGEQSTKWAHGDVGGEPSYIRVQESPLPLVCGVHDVRMSVVRQQLSHTALMAFYGGQVKGSHPTGVL